MHSRIFTGISGGGRAEQAVKAGAVAGWDLHSLESAAFPRRTPIAVIDWIEIPRRSNTEVCYSFHSEAREVRGSETAQPGGILT